MAFSPQFHGSAFHAKFEFLTLVEIPGTSDLFLDTQVQIYVRAGVVSLWVAGHFVNQFDTYLNFANVDRALETRPESPVWAERQRQRG